MFQVYFLKVFLKAGGWGIDAKLILTNMDLPLYCKAHFLKVSNTMIIQNIIYGLKEDFSVNNCYTVKVTFSFLTLVEQISAKCAWSFALEDISFLTVMCQGKQTGINSTPLCSPVKRWHFREHSEEAPVTREHVQLNVCRNPRSRVGQLPLPAQLTTSPQHIFCTQPVS